MKFSHDVVKRNHVWGIEWVPLTSGGKAVVSTAAAGVVSGLYSLSIPHKMGSFLKEISAIERAVCRKSVGAMGSTPTDGPRQKLLGSGASVSD